MYANDEDFDSNVKAVLTYLAQQLFDYAPVLLICPLR